MMLLSGQSNRVWHYWAGLHFANPDQYPTSVGTLLSPSYWRKVPIDPWMPFALDNGAFKAWRDKEPWNHCQWANMLSHVRMSGCNPLWITVPDAVGDKDKTLLRWEQHHREAKSYGWPLAFCVQDGMVPADVPEDADVIFVGGTDRWKFPNLKRWTDAFPRVHCARVNAPEMIEACERCGCESIDGTGWFKDPFRQDKLPAIQRFIEGHRNKTKELCFE